MKYNICIALLLVLSISQTQSAIQWQEGLSQAIQQGGGHSLETSTATPRFEDVRVEFDEEFSLTPQVVLALSEVSWENGDGADFKVKVLDTDTTGFTYRVNVNFERAFNQVGVKWFAFVDPHLQQETYEFKVYGVNGDSDKRQTQFSIDFEREYKDLPNVAVFLLGASWNQQSSSYDVHIDATQVTSKGCTVLVETYDDGNPYSVYAQVVVLPNDRSQVDLEGGVLNLIQNGDVQSEEIDTTISQNYGDNDGVLFYGLSGISSSSNKNFNIAANLNEQNLSISSSADSGLANANIDVFGYDPTDDCSFLFVGCNFSGNGISICQDQARNSFVGSHIDQNSIRSIYVPQGQVLTLYEGENLTGRQATFSETQECIEQLQADE